ncbi:XrtY-associated glycosyltransferase XYAG1 [Pedobacter sandarakinus]|uniref:XrtY-associated glycosyltransferase XYAG1 n=1 Tax=Pedobacter sandarakinus TaxID=353156 RepID=UPI00224763B1|nr:glycosyltransferase [Pedobacter sandarakinus]MCX2575906.1 glycosyltransferase [Pedobacter sandarakinus]
MKIIQVTASYKPAFIYGGPIQSVGKLCEALIQHADGGQTKACIEGSAPLSLEVITTTANGADELEIKSGSPQIVDGVPVTYFKRLTKDHTHFSPQLLWHLRKLLINTKAKEMPTIVHIHAWWNMVSVLSCLVARWYRVPVVLSPRGMLTSYTQHNRNSIAKRFIHWIIGKRLLRYCHIHATSTQEQVEIKQMVQSKSSHVIWNLATKDIHRYNMMNYPAIADEDQTFRLIFLSRIEEKKGLEILFDALKHLKKNWHLTIAGAGLPGYLASLKTITKQLQLENRITWVGQIADTEKYALMARHDLLVLPSYNENFANVVVESLSVGTPVLVSNRVGLADYVQENGFGWVCKLNADDLRQQLEVAYHDLDKRRWIRASAPELIQSAFSEKTLVNNYLRMYEEVLA